LQPYLAAFIGFGPDPSSSTDTGFLPPRHSPNTRYAAELVFALPLSAACSAAVRRVQVRLPIL
jgi:hypothetical protein